MSGVTKDQQRYSLNQRVRHAAVLLLLAGAAWGNSFAYGMGPKHDDPVATVGEPGEGGDGPDWRSQRDAKVSVREAANGSGQEEGRKHGVTYPIDRPEQLDRHKKSQEQNAPGNDDPVVDPAEKEGVREAAKDAGKKKREKLGVTYPIDRPGNGEQRPAEKKSVGLLREDPHKSQMIEATVVGPGQGDGPDWQKQEVKEGVREAAREKEAAVSGGGIYKPSDKK